VAVACVCLALVSIVFARQTQKLQADVQSQQVTINKGALSQQIGAKLVHEMAVVAQTDEKMKQLLHDNGYDISNNSKAAQP
ncbi:MAG: hypothetical protein ACREP1_00860, partial [Rhodanobacteraceae bacterium]